MPASMAPSRDMAIRHLRAGSRAECLQQRRDPAAAKARALETQVYRACKFLPKYFGRRHSRSRRDRPSELRQRLFQMQQVGEDIAGVKWPMAPMRITFPPSLLREPAITVRAARTCGARCRRPSEPFGPCTQTTVLEKRFRLRECAPARRPRSRAQGRGQPPVPRQHICGKPSSWIISRASCSPPSGDTGVVNGVSRFLRRRHAPCGNPSSIAAAGRRGSPPPTPWGSEITAHAGRAHQRLLRGRGHDIDAPLVLPHLDSAEPAHGIHHQQRGPLAQHGSDARPGPRPRRWSFRCARPPPRGNPALATRFSISAGSSARPQGTSSVSTRAPSACAMAAKRSPNCPWDGDQHALAGRQDVDEAASIMPVPELAKKQTAIACAQNRLDHFLRAPQNRPELGPAMAQHRPRHGLPHAFRHGGRSRQPQPVSRESITANSAAFRENMAPTRRQR